jgi:hypothetical protein
MTDSHTEPAPLGIGVGRRTDRLLICLFVARLFLAAVAVSLVLFLYQWSSAVERETVGTPLTQNVPDEWRVVIPEYAGGGRGSTLVALKPWKFGTMREHPIQVALCVGAAALAAVAFAGCTWYASCLKRVGHG